MHLKTSTHIQQYVGQIVRFLSLGESFFICLAGCMMYIDLCVMGIDRLHYFPAAPLGVSTWVLQAYPSQPQLKSRYFFGSLL